MAWEDFLAPGSSLIGSGVSAALAAREARRQRKWARKNYKHRFQWSMEDMKKAGLNPLLAAGMGLGGGGTPSGAAAQVPDFGRVGETINTGRRVKNETATQRTQRLLMSDQAGTAREQARKAGAEADIIAAGQPYADMEREFYTTAAGRAAYFADKMGGAGSALGAGIVGGIIGRGRRPRSVKPDTRGPLKKVKTPKGRPMSKREKEKLRKRIVRDFIKD